MSSSSAMRGSASGAMSSALSAATGVASSARSGASGTMSAATMSAASGVASSVASSALSGASAVVSSMGSSQSSAAGSTGGGVGQVAGGTKQGGGQPSWSVMATAYFAVAMLGLLAVLCGAHGIRVLSSKSKSTNIFMRTGRKVTRTFRSVTIRSIWGFPSVGHSLLLAIYIGINLLLSFVNVDRSTNLNAFCKRMGWTAGWNIAFITFLALKNTPLAFLSSYSYERLNSLHQAAGYVTIGAMLIHSLGFIGIYVPQNKIAELRTKSTNIPGEVAGLAMMIIFATAVLLRKVRYEVFYSVHIIMFMLIVITAAMHEPGLAKSFDYIMIFTGIIWVLDRVIRAGRMLWFSYGNSATVSILPNGGMRVTLKRPTARAVSGTHLFLWLPKIRLFESHPFTIANTNPIEVVIKAHNGFTKDLMAYAAKNPGATLRVGMDGPYGTLPNFMNFEQINLIAGGSGASYTFGVAIDMIRKLTSNSNVIINFTWVVREDKSLTWFSDAVAELKASRHVNLNIFVTNHSSSSKEYTTPLTDSSENVSKSSTRPSIDEKKPYVVVNASDVEKRSTTSIDGGDFASTITYNQRPNVRDLIRAAIEAAGQNDRILVSACGPVGMLAEVRSTVACVLFEGERSVTLHNESFGW